MDATGREHKRVVASSVNHPFSDPKLRDYQPTTRHERYDCIVIGLQWGGLLAAGLAARLGLSVLVVPFMPVGSLMTTESQDFLDFHSNFFLGLGQSREGERGLLLAALEKLKPAAFTAAGFWEQQGQPQILTPHHRVRVGESLEQIAAEFYREWGRQAVEQSGVLEALPLAELHLSGYWQGVQGSFERRQEQATGLQASSLTIVQQQLAHALPRKLLTGGESHLEEGLGLGSERFAEIMQGYCFWLLGKNPQAVSFFDFLQLFALKQQGAAFPGGRENLRSFLLEAARAHGAHLAHPYVVQRILVQRGHFLGVQLAGYAQVVRGDFAILGSPLSRAMEKIDYLGLRWPFRQKQVRKPQSWRFTLTLTLPRAAVPTGMEVRSVWFQTDTPPVEWEWVAAPAERAAGEVTLDQARPAEATPSAGELIMLCVRTLLPYQEHTVELQYQKAIAGRLLQLIALNFPFLPQSILKVFPRCSPEPAPVGRLDPFVQWYGFRQLESIPEDLLVFEAPGSGIDSGINHLFLNSDETYPQFASLGPTLAALEIVDLIAEKRGLPGPLSAGS